MPFNDLGSFLQTLLAVMSITALAGVGLQRTRFNEQKAALGEAREEIADKDRRLHEAESKITALETARKADRRAAEAQREADRLKIRNLEKNIVDLAASVSSDAHWVAIGDTLDNHHSEAKQHWNEDERLLSLVAGELGAVQVALKDFTAQLRRDTNDRKKP